MMTIIAATIFTIGLCTAIIIFIIAPIVMKANEESGAI